MRHALGHGWMPLVVMRRRRIRSILQGLRFEIKCLRTIVVLVITDCRRNAVELQADAGSTRPCIRRRCIAFDLTSAAAFACSHHWDTLACACACHGGRITPAWWNHTFQAFVSIVLVYEYIVWIVMSVTFSPPGKAVCGLTALVLAWRQRGRRKGKALHLRRLGQQWPSSRVRGHNVLMNTWPVRSGSARPGAMVASSGVVGYPLK